MARIYDEGYAPIAFAMATEVQKILTENGAATRLRGTRTFTSPDYGDETSLLNAMHKLTSALVGGDPPTLTFVPDFYSGEDGLRELPYREWWNRDIIYQASAAEPGTPAGLIPVNDTPVVPYEDREKITRMRLVNLLRNKIAAHQSADMPLLLDEIQTTNTWAGFSCQTPEGVLSTDDGSLPVIVGPIPAMMRQITHELLVAYGRDDPPPPGFATPKSSDP
jgi:hypothetical protein